MGRGGQGSPHRAPQALRPRPLAIGEAARAELRDSLRSIADESAPGARTVLERVDRKLTQLQRFPQGAPEDPEAASVPTGSLARKTHAAGFTIRYLYPIAIRDRRDGLLIVSIRRSERLPISDAEFLARYAVEQARLRRQRA